MPESDPSRRAVVTGLGAVTPLGPDLASTWTGMMQGVCAVGPITTFDTTNFPCTLAAYVKDFDPMHYMSKREARRMASFVQFALAAASQALTDARLDLSREDATRLGVEIGSAIGGTDVVEEQSLVLQQHGIKTLA